MGNANTSEAQIAKGQQNLFSSTGLPSHQLEKIHFGGARSTHIGSNDDAFQCLVDLTHLHRAPGACDSKCVCCSTERDEGGPHARLRNLPHRCSSARHRFVLLPSPSIPSCDQPSPSISIPNPLIFLPPPPSPQNGVSPAGAPAGLVLEDNLLVSCRRGHPGCSISRSRSG